MALLRRLVGLAGRGGFTGIRLLPGGTEKADGPFLRRKGEDGKQERDGIWSGRETAAAVGFLLPKTVPGPGRRPPPVSADVAPALMALEICLPEPPVLRREMARWGEAGLLTSGSTVRLRLPGKSHQWPNAAVVPDHSGGTAPESHGIPLAPTHVRGNPFRSLNYY
jgi:hypothetical protein